MAIVQCPYCHEMVATIAYPLHVQKHEKKREDGQQADYATLPEGQRTEGELEGVPRWYRHEACGTVTGMPEEIIRTYLENPFFYGSDTFCAGCRKHVHERECAWVETGENLHEYKLGLQAAKPELRPWPTWIFVAIGVGIAIIGGVIGALKGK